MQEEIILGGGCFWCLEAVYQRIEGVIKVEPGYTGGTTESPTYQDVRSQKFGFIEVIKVTFDSSIITLTDILEFFWKIHDPTSMDKQGGDHGVQYRSAIFYTKPDQLEIVNASLKIAQEHRGKEIVTQIRELDVFYPAESYHENYFNSHLDQPYCQFVILPKLKKLSLKV